MRLIVDIKNYCVIYTVMWAAMGLYGKKEKKKEAQLY